MLVKRWTLPDDFVPNIFSLTLHGTTNFIKVIRRTPSESTFKIGES
jgi:hypothetical protein